MKSTTLKPTSKITYNGDNVTMVVSCEYPAGKTQNTADAVWAIVADFVNIKIIFPSVIRNYITYPVNAQEPTETIGTIRDMTFYDASEHSFSTGIEQLQKINEAKKALEYTSLGGLPVTNYKAVMSVTGKNACKLTWTVTYEQGKGKKAFAKILAGIFEGGEAQIGKAIGL